MIRFVRARKSLDPESERTKRTEHIEHMEQTAKQTKNVQELVRFALDVCESMLVCGGEVSRVEDTAARILRSYGAVRVDAFTIISCISLSATFADGTVETQIRRVNIKAYTTDLDRLERLNALSREICAQRPPIEIERARWMQSCTRHKGARLSEFLRCIGYMLAGGAFAVFFGGTLSDALGATIVCFLAWALDLLFKKADLQRLFHSFLIAFLVALSTLPIVLSGLGIHAGYIMMGGIMLLIPGISITNSMRDLLIGDTISGILRLVESILIACCVAAGFAVAILISRGVLPSEGAYTVARLPYIQVLMAALGSLGFGMTFRLPYKRLLLCTLGGGLTWVVYLICEAYIPNAFLCVAIAAAFGAVYAEVLARICKTPAALFTILAEIALIPGGKLYWTMDYLVCGEQAAALRYGAQTVSSALAIALGIVFVAALANTLSGFKKGARRFIG